MSMNLIIIAAIALLVLVILAVLVLRGSGNVAAGTGCQARGGDCNTALTSSCPTGETFYPAGGCTATQRCCIPNPV